MSHYQPLEHDETAFEKQDHNLHIDDTLIPPYSNHALGHDQSQVYGELALPAIYERTNEPDHANYIEYLAPQNGYYPTRPNVYPSFAAFGTEFHSPRHIPLHSPRHTPLHSPIQIPSSSFTPRFSTRGLPQDINLSRGPENLGASLANALPGQDYTATSKDIANHRTLPSSGKPSPVGVDFPKKIGIKKNPRIDRRSRSRPARISQRSSDTTQAHRKNRLKSSSRAHQGAGSFGPTSTEEWAHHSESSMQDTEPNTEPSEIPHELVKAVFSYAMRSLHAQSIDELSSRLQGTGDLPRNYHPTHRSQDINLNLTLADSISNDEIVSQYRAYREVRSASKGSGLWTCTCGHGCEQSFKRQGDWKRHQCQHFPPTIWICPHRACKKVCTRKDRFDEHLAKRHEGTTINQECCFQVTESEYPKECRWEHCDQRFTSHDKWLAHDAEYIHGGIAAKIGFTNSENEEEDDDVDNESEASDPDAEGDDDVDFTGFGDDDQNPGASGGSGGSASFTGGYFGYGSSSSGNQTSGRDTLNSSYHNGSEFHGNYTAGSTFTWPQPTVSQEPRLWKNLATYRLVLLPSLSWGVPKFPVVLKQIQLHVALNIESDDAKTMNRIAILWREITLMADKLRESSPAYKIFLDQPFLANIEHLRQSFVHHRFDYSQPNLLNMYIRPYSLDNSIFPTIPEDVQRLLRRLYRGHLKCPNIRSSPLYAYQDFHSSAPDLTRSSATSSEHSELSSGCYQQATIQEWLDWSASIKIQRPKTIMYSPQISVSQSCQLSCLSGVLTLRSILSAKPTPTKHFSVHHLERIWHHQINPVFARWR